MKIRECFQSPLIGLEVGSRLCWITKKQLRTATNQCDTSDDASFLVDINGYRPNRRQKCIIILDLAIILLELFLTQTSPNGVANPERPLSAARFANIAEYKHRTKTCFSDKASYHGVTGGRTSTWTRGSMNGDRWLWNSATWTKPLILNVGN